MLIQEVRAQLNYVEDEIMVALAFGDLPVAQKLAVHKVWLEEELELLKPKLVDAKASDEEVLEAA